MKSKILEITKDRFQKYNVIKEPMLDFIATEEKWFADNDEKLLGVILKDKIDRDWNSVVLALDEDGAYRATEVNVSIESIEETEKELLDLMNKIVHEGKSEELLFKSDKVVDKKTESLVITDIDVEIKKYFKVHPEKLYDLSPRKFEELIASILEDMGFDVELTKATRDRGRDIIASVKSKLWNFLAYVECKKYSPVNKVGVGIIREVIGVHHLRKPSKSMIVTTSFFSKDAVKEAKIMENDLDLKDYTDIKDWLKGY